MRQLLHTALRLRQGRGQSSALPEQLLALFQQCYHELGRPERLALFRSLTATFGIQAHELDTAVAAWQHLRQQQQQQAEQQKLGGEVGPTAGPAPDQLFKAAAQLSAAATPLYTRLLSPLSQQLGGIKFLVDMRGELLQVRVGVGEFLGKRASGSQDGWARMWRGGQELRLVVTRYTWLWLVDCRPSRSTHRALRHCVRCRKRCVDAWQSGSARVSCKTVWCLRPIACGDCTE